MYVGVKLAIATESYTATRAGYEAYRAGGNAVDAAVAASAVLTYTLPHLGGMGGDMLALVERGGRVEALLALGWAPRAVPRRPPERGVQSAVVPGYPAGIYELHRRYGALEWGKAVEIALEAMRQATVHPSLAAAVRQHRQLLEADPGGRHYLSLPPAGPYRIGPLLELWRALGQHGPQFFYREVAGDLAAELGHFTPEDFAGYRPEWRGPLSMPYGPCTVYEAPPPSLGFAVLLALKLSRPPDDPFSYGRIADAISALRRAHWARDRYLGDVEVPVGDLLSREDLGEAESPRPTGDTTYLAAADGELAVSLIQSLYYPFGAAVTSPRWAVTLNNRAYDFTDGPNAPAPGKRPAHTLSAMVLDCGGSTYAVGASAGHYRPAVYLQLAQNIARYGMDPRRAIWAPRFIWLGGRRAQAEEGYQGGPGVELVRYPSRMGVAQLAARLGAGVAAVADIRGDGLALGL